MHMELKIAREDIDLDCNKVKRSWFNARNMFIVILNISILVFAITLIISNARTNLDRISLIALMAGFYSVVWIIKLSETEKW